MLLNNGVAIKYLATDAVFSCTSDALVIITAEMDDLQPMSSDNIYDDSGSFHFWTGLVPYGGECTQAGEQVEW